MAKVYGYSDDIVVIEHIEGGSTEIDCYDKDVSITFEDGTIISISYGKGDQGIWSIWIDETGLAPMNMTVCEDEDAAIYSDIFEIEAEAVSYSVDGRRTNHEQS